MLAAKVVNVAKKEDRRAVQREVEIMRRLQHPRLIQLYDAIDAGKQIYVILELYVVFFSSFTYAFKLHARGIT